eukprot:jgi/Tetstr1/439749/TSEL_028163.t1
MADFRRGSRSASGAENRKPSRSAGVFAVIGRGSLAMGSQGEIATRSQAATAPRRVPTEHSSARSSSASTKASAAAGHSQQGPADDSGDSGTGGQGTAHELRAGGVSRPRAAELACAPVKLLAAASKKDYAVGLLMVSGAVGTLKAARALLRALRHPPGPLALPAPDPGRLKELEYTPAAPMTAEADKTAQRGPRSSTDNAVDDEVVTSDERIAAPGVAGADGHELDLDADQRGKGSKSSVVGDPPAVAIKLQIGGSGAVGVGMRTGNEAAVIGPDDDVDAAPPPFSGDDKVALSSRDVWQGDVRRAAACDDSGPPSTVAMNDQALPYFVGGITPTESTTRQGDQCGDPRASVGGARNDKTELWVGSDVFADAVFTQTVSPLGEPLAGVSSAALGEGWLLRRNPDRGARVATSNDDPGSGASGARRSVPDTADDDEAQVSQLVDGLIGELLGDAAEWRTVAAEEERRSRQPGQPSSGRASLDGLVATMEGSWFGGGSPADTSPPPKPQTPDNHPMASHWAAAGSLSRDGFAERASGGNARRSVAAAAAVTTRRPRRHGGLSALPRLGMCGSSIGSVRAGRLSLRRRGRVSEPRCALQVGGAWGGCGGQPVSRWLAVMLGAVASVPLAVMLSAPRSAAAWAATPAGRLVQRAAASLRGFWEAEPAAEGGEAQRGGREACRGRSPMALAAAAALPLFLLGAQERPAAAGAACLSPWSVGFPVFVRVERGETMWTLAERFYGRGSFWPVISAANVGVLPRTLRAGSLLRLHLSPASLLGGRQPEAAH